MNILIVAVGGGLGAVMRYLMSEWTHAYLSPSSFPAGTAVVNILGCLAIGLLGGHTESLESFSPQARLFLFLGVLGGFTTFSSFGHETMRLLREGQMFHGLANVGLHVCIGLVAVWIGYRLTHA